MLCKCIQMLTCFNRSRAPLTNDRQNKCSGMYHSVAHFVPAVSARRLVPFPQVLLQHNSHVNSQRVKYGTDLKAFIGFDAVTLTYESYLIGKGIILFTLFYCSLNWAMYRRTRKDFENKNKNPNDKDK